MPKSISELFVEAAKKGGIDPTNPQLVDLLSRGELDKIPVPDEVAGAISGLMGFDAAINNQKVKGHFRQNLLETMDDKLHDLAESMGLPASALDAIKGEKSSFAKPDLLKAHLVEKLKEAKKTASANGDDDKVKSLNEQIAQLNAQLAQEKQARQEEVQREKQARIAYIRDQAIRSEASQHRWSEAIPEDSRVDLYNLQLNKRLAAMEAELHTDEQGNIILKRKDGSDYYDPATNVKVGFKDLSARIMADNRFLAVSAPAGQATGSNANGSSQIHNTVVTGNPGQANIPMNPAMQQRKQAADAALEEFRRNQQELAGPNS